MAVEEQYTEKREHPRQLLYENACLINDRKAYLGKILDYSYSGIYITSNMSVNIGEKLSISIPRPEKLGKMSEETALVVRKKRSGFALEFL